MRPRELKKRARVVRALRRYFCRWLLRCSVLHSAGRSKFRNRSFGVAALSPMSKIEAMKSLCAFKSGNAAPPLAAAAAAAGIAAEAAAERAVSSRRARAELSSGSTVELLFRSE